MRTPHASSSESQPPPREPDSPERESPGPQPGEIVRRTPIRTQPPPFRPPPSPATFQPPRFAETHFPLIFIGLLVLVFVGSAAFLLWSPSPQNDLGLTSEEFRVLTEAANARSAASEEPPSSGGAPGSAVLDIATTPSGVLVSIDGEIVGVTPLRLGHLSPRPHFVSLESPGFSTTDTLVELNEELPTMISLVLAPSTSGGDVPPLSLDSDPPPVPRPAAAPVVSEEARPPKPSPPPAPTSGSIDVKVNPARTPVQLDGQTVGVAPLELRDVPAGPHTLTFFLPGYENASVRVHVEPGVRENVEVTLTPETGTVVVVVRPWGSVYIDGVLRARETDLSFEATLPPGRHQIRVEHPELGTQERTIEVQPHRTTSAVFDLN